MNSLFSSILSVGLSFIIAITLGTAVYADQALVTHDEMIVQIYAYQNAEHAELALVTNGFQQFGLEYDPYFYATHAEHLQIGQCLLVDRATYGLLNISSISFKEFVDCP